MTEKILLFEFLKNGIFIIFFFFGFNLKDFLVMAQNGY